MTNRKLLLLVGCVLVVFGVVQNVPGNFEGFVRHVEVWIAGGAAP